MVSFGHTAVGVIVGVTVYKFLGQGDLTVGLIITGAVGVVSHYITDFIPHGHFFKPKDFKKGIIPVIIFDLLLPIIFFLGVIYAKGGFSEKLLYIIFGIGGAQLPDIVDGLISIRVIQDNTLLEAENSFHQSLHWHGKGAKTLLLGLKDFWQLLIILVALFWVIFN